NIMRDEYAQEVKEAEAKYKLAGVGAANAGARTMAVFKDAANIAEGKKLFTGANLCYTCHREDGGGLVGPNLTDDFWKHGSSVDSLVASIEHGYPEKGMLPYGNNTKLGEKEVMQIVSYIVSLHGTNPPNPKPVDKSDEKQETWNVQ
ncbi:MAG: c-type cytochrome, partial [Candidatus Kapaibacteriota bacterium]